jgi:moderate conductance mechanosensitive channel
MVLLTALSQALALGVSDETTANIKNWLDSGWGHLVIIIVVVLIAALSVGLWRRFVHRTAKSVVESSVTKRLSGNGGSERAQRITMERQRARANAVAGLLISTGSFVIVVIAVLLILGQLGINITPLIASAGVAGIAIGFGAQTIIRDFLSGVFMIMESQFGVGDVISVSGITGTVDGVSLRITRLRDADGTLWYVTNGSVTELGNRSQGWSVAVVDVPVGYGADLTRVKDLLTQTCVDMQEDETWSQRIMSDEPQVAVESMTPLGVTVRIRLHTIHDQQLTVARELRVRAVSALDAEGLVTPATPGDVAASDPGAAQPT